MSETAENAVKTPDYRKCKSCGRILPISMYYPNAECRGGYEPRCKECKSKRRACTTSSRDFSISDIPDEVLVTELRNRGYTGEIRKSKVIKI